MTKAVSKGKDVERNSQPPSVKVRRKPGRVPVSCAECRRLKLRCDRKVPCETCVKRGCSAICPEGSLTTGNRSNRLAFADAEELQKKVERLRSRVNVLEDALRKLHADVSDDPHPLLVDRDETQTPGDSPQAASTPGRPRSVLSSIPMPNEPGALPQTDPNDEEFIGAFGTLTLGLKGEARFYGSTARPEFLVHAPRYDAWNDVGTKPEDFPRLSRVVYEEASKGFDKPCEILECKQEIFQMLPSLSEACRLCDLYLEAGDYMWYAIPRSQLYDEILGVIYRSASDLAVSPDPGFSSLNALSVLYMVFCLGTLVDKEHPPCSLQAKEYYMLGRLALRCASPMFDITLWTIQSLIYQASFLQFYAESGSAPHFVSHYAWLQLGFAAKLGTSIGLHVKSSKWHLDEEASQRRAAVFWQLVVQDGWISFTFGRPPCINLAWVDCELPKDPHEKMDAEGHLEWGFNAWVCQYTRLLHTVMSTALAAKVPTYAKLLELDRKIRDFPVPWSLRGKCGQTEPVTPSTKTSVQRYFLMICKEITLLNLHRPYFAQALNESPQALLKHRYSPSVLAIYRSAWRLIEALRDTHGRAPFVVERYGFGWSTAMSAGIIMCLLVTRAPTSSFAPASLHELDRLCEIFERCAGPQSPSAAANVDVVRKLQSQAHEAASKMEQDDRSSPALSELDRLGGKTHLLSEGAPRPSPPPDRVRPFCGLSPRNDAPSPPDALSSTVSSAFGPIQLFSGVEENLHPIILSDLQTFEGFSNATATAGASSMRAPLDDFTFDLTQPFPLPVEAQYPPVYRTLQEVSSYFGTEYLGAPVGPSTGTNLATQGMQQPPVQSSPFAPPLGTPDVPYSGIPLNPPVLDATWQSFVEQLGF